MYKKIYLRHFSNLNSFFILIKNINFWIKHNKKANRMNDIELTNVMTAEGKDNGEFNSLLNVESTMSMQELYVNTRYGKVWVTIQGDLSKTCFVTYPDIGLNCKHSYSLNSLFLIINHIIFCLLIYYSYSTIPWIF